MGRRGTYSDEVYEVVPIVDVFFDVDGEGCAHHGLEEEDDIVKV